MLDVDNYLRQLVLDVDRQVEATFKAMRNPEEKSIVAVEERDDYLDNQKSVIENSTFEIIHGAKESAPGGINYLRAVNVAASNLERVGDHAVCICRQLRHLSDSQFLERFDYPPLFKLVREALGKVVDSFVRQDMDKALFVCRSELSLDQLYKKEFDHILNELEDGEQAGDLVTALFIFRYLERMGDALLNIGEAAIFAITGNKFKIKQYEGLNSVLKSRGEDNPLSEMEFQSIWGSRSGCRIGRVHKRDDSDGLQDAIFKDGSSEKLLSEAANIACWEKLSPGLAPKVEVVREGSKHASLLIEALPGRTLQDIILSARNEDIDPAMQALFRTTRELWGKSRKPAPAKAEFMTQLKKRLPEVLKLHPDFEALRVSMAGAVIPSLHELIEQAGEFEAGLEAPFSIFAHGDFNSNNIIYDEAKARIHYIDLHRSAYSDYCQDVSVFLISNYRLRVFDGPRRKAINSVIWSFLEFARDFAAEQGDKGFEARLCLGLARSLLTSTRFEQTGYFAKRMFLSGVYLLEKIHLHRAAPEDFRLPPCSLIAW